MKINKKRLIGVALFGFLLSLCIGKSFDYVVPSIISMAKHIDLSMANEEYSSLLYLHAVISIVFVFFGAGVAAFLFKKSGLLVGLLSNSLYILLYGFLFTSTIITKDASLVGGISYQLLTFLQLILIISASLLGGYYGEKFYSPDLDLDLDSDKVTIFGVRWYHYFWIMPIILYSFFASALVCIYAFVVLFLSYIYIGFHPSLWGHLFSLIYIPLVPGAVYGSIYLTGYGFGRFFEVMRYKQIEAKGWKKLWKVFLYGIIIPAVSFFFASYAASYIHSLPTPSVGDWKWVVIYFVGFYGIFALYSLYSWIVDRLKK